MLFTTSEAALCAPDYINEAPQLISSSQDQGTFHLSAKADHL
jgi:hypothetical protein